MNKKIVDLKNMLISICMFEEAQNIEKILTISKDEILKELYRFRDLRNHAKELEAVSTGDDFLKYRYHRETLEKIMETIMIL